MGTMLRAYYEIVSEKHGVKGIINDYGVVIKLRFEYMEKDVEIALNRPFSEEEDALEKLGCATIDSYIDILLSDNDSARRVMLHYWYVDEISHGGEKYKLAHGIVSGHRRLADATFIHTSMIKKIYIDEKYAEAVIETKNTVYFCPLAYCRFDKQDIMPEFIPDYETIKAKYDGKIEYPTIEEDKVLLVFSNFDEYYFNSLYCRPKGAESALPYEGYAHVGMFQDSYLISCYEANIDLRYFPHYQNVEFYSENTGGKPWFIENIGDIILFAKTSKGLIKLEPGERKEVAIENAEEVKPVLPKGDLYPAGIIE